jgi:benzoyl-CoA reductase/2-hydroxyglutaryl-CoA dehydratase subunit BcrC/BadD/HgdB
LLKYQIKQTKALQKEKIFVTPAAMKEKFKRLAETLRKRPNEDSEALKRLFPEGLKMKWIVDKWEIAGVTTQCTFS